ncbi:MAG: FAD-dependent oxidoreductase, partial [Thioalkalivibrio sp.]|nr:FAD-dependent oxidoreductase [Thioalkalivibrio sp.]
PFYVRPRPSLDLVAWGVRFALAANARHVQRTAPSLLALNLRSRELWNDLARELGDVGFNDRGLLMLCRTQKALEEEAHIGQMARSLGLRAETLDAAAVRNLEPDIDLDVAGAVRFPDDAHMDPRALMEALQARLQADGVQFRFATHANRLSLRNGRATGVATSPAENDSTAKRSATPTDPPETVLEADHVILAAGAWSSTLARDAGLRLLLQPGKGYSLTIANPTQSLRSAAILVEAKAAASAIGDRFRIGGTMELAGFDANKNQRRIAGIKRSALAYFPSLSPVELDEAEVWHGFRPLSPDGLPYLGPAPDVPNVIVATGHAMMGLSAGPATGRAVAQLVAGESPEVDLRHFRPERHT